MDDLTQYGVGAAIAIIILKLVFDFIKTFRKPQQNNSIDPNRIENKLNEIHELTKKIWDIHNKYDADGSPLWYVPRSWHDMQMKILDITKQIRDRRRKSYDEDI